MEYRYRELQTREMRETPSGWEFDALAVPYDTPTRIAPGVTETIVRGALRPVETGVKLRLEHQTTIGTITDLREGDNGLEITAHISDTTAGRDARALLNDGALRSLSIGFLPDEEGSEYTDSDGENVTVIRRSAQLFEVSLVSFPAYPQAEVKEIRNRKEPPAMEKEAPEYTALREAVEDNTRSIAMLSEKMTATAPVSEMPYRSYGEYARALVAGEEAALRAFDGAVTTDDGMTRPAWVARALESMVAKQTLTNLFTHSYDLPGKGMSIEYPTFGTDTLVVAKQANEGDTLSYGKITTSTGTAPVCTYGGYSQVSRQVIERSDPAYLSTLFTRQAMHYATTIEAATRALVAKTIETQTAGSPLTVSKALTTLTADDLIKIILDAAEHYDTETTLTLDGVLASKDVFTRLATMREESKLLKFSGAEESKAGEISIRGMSGTVLNVPVTMVSGLETSTFAFYNRSAIEVKESGGAPYRLQDENIINLSAQFSVYGYAAHYSPDPAAIIPVKVNG
ncbi:MULTISPECIES: HK97 family phage prohead protease [unclassified Actinotignum]|uniref:HK97 family phage prohead protease n=1 Tax=unclassified Actinotignum TaxID=2632702 RepID=UPI002A83D44A|nr:HK97 family phage prohead protease [Actinotignum sp. SLA_B059]MDY5127460.1 HK97 family phage prohead protease [Actinotignum sp. SLA_B059]